MVNMHTFSGSFKIVREDEATILYPLCLFDLRRAHQCQMQYLQPPVLMNSQLMKEYAELLKKYKYKFVLASVTDLIPTEYIQLAREEIYGKYFGDDVNILSYASFVKAEQISQIHRNLSQLDRNTDEYHYTTELDLDAIHPLLLV
jgi:hypothetical protein